jgi:uncharacterized protein YjbI with pentapeptide repeats
LPLFDIRLPLETFFALAPVAIVAFHLFILVHIGLLAQNWRALSERLATAEIASERREEFLRRLDTFFVTQWLARRRQGSWALRFLINLLVWITLLLGPVVLLLAIQVRFLPYHSANITAWQRLTLFSDLAALWVMWPILRSHDRWTLHGRGWRSIGSFRGVAAGVTTLALVGFSLLLATVPGTKDAPEAPLEQWWIRSWIATKHIPQGTSINSRCLPQLKFFAEGLRPIPVSCLWLPSTWVIKIVTEDRAIWLPTAILFEGVDPIAGQRQSLFSRNLVVPSQKLVPETSGTTVPREDNGTNQLDANATLSLRGRDLRYATLLRSDLRGADFGGADLRGADLSFTDLQGAKFDCLKGRGGDALPQTCSQLEGANLSDAKLQGASFEGAQLQRAFLYKSSLQGASLVDANLENAVLDLASLQGADFAQTNLSQAETSDADTSVANTAESLNGACENDPQHPHKEEARIANFTKLACEPQDAPHVAAGIITFLNRPICGDGPDIRAAKLRLLCRLREPKCYGAHGLSDSQMVLTDNQNPWVSFNPTSQECDALAGQTSP